MKKITMFSLVASSIISSATASVNSAVGVQLPTLSFEQEQDKAGRINAQIMIDRAYKRATTLTQNSTVCIENGCTSKLGSLQIEYPSGSFPKKISGLNFDISQTLANEFLTIDEKKSFSNNYNFNADFISFVMRFYTEIESDELRLENNLPNLAAGSYLLPENSFDPVFIEWISNSTSSYLLNLSAKRSKILTDEKIIPDEVTNNILVKRIMRAPNYDQAGELSQFMNLQQDSAATLYGFGDKQARYYLETANILQYLYTHDQKQFKSLTKMFFDYLKSPNKRTIREKQYDEYIDFFKNTDDVDIYQCDTKSAKTFDVIKGSELKKYLELQSPTIVKFYEHSENLNASWLKNGYLNITTPDGQKRIFTKNANACNTFVRNYPKDFFIEKKEQNSAPYFNIFNNCAPLPASALIVKEDERLDELVAAKFSSSLGKISDKMKLKRAFDRKMKLYDFSGKAVFETHPLPLIYEDENMITFTNTNNEVDPDIKVDFVLFKNQKSCLSVLNKANMSNEK